MATIRTGRGDAGPKAPRSSRGARAGKTAVPFSNEASVLRSAAANAKSGEAQAAADFLEASTARAREANRCAVEGARLVKQGRPGQAVALLKRAVELGPAVAASHHDLGLALLAAGRLEQAQEPFAAAARLDPALASAHHNLAYVLDSLGREGEALASYEAAVRLQPDLAIAQSRLGDLYLARRRRAEAAAAFRAAAAATAGTVSARIAEARSLVATGDVEEAITRLVAVVEAEPDCAEGHVVLAKILAQVGRSAEAAGHFERAARLSPDMAAAWSGVAMNRRFTAADGPLIALMNACLSRPTLTPFHRQALHFALGKAHDDVGSYAVAIRHVEAANRLRGKNAGLNREALARRIDQLIAATPPGFVARQPHPGVDDPTPILIIGMPRSGTTLVEQVLSSHPQVAAGGELEFWGARDVRREDNWSITAAPEMTRRLADDYLGLLRAVGPQAARVTDKAPFNFPLLGLIHRVFPRATIIHTRRHPIDTCLSIFSTNFEMNFDFAASRGDLVFFYRQYQRMMAHWREVLPPDRFIEVDYEALVADPEPGIRRLVAACGLPWDDACLAHHDNPHPISTASMWQARQPIYRTSVEKWRRYEPWLGELRELAPAR
jgi:tetratricopeptide (TPR) repeat protein